MKVYVARDEVKTFGKDLFLYLDKPVKYSSCWRSGFEHYFPISEDLLPEGVNPQWEDEEPIELEMTLNIHNNK